MSDLANAIKQICDEKGLSYDAVIATIESALAAAYRKDFGERNQNIKVEFNPETGKSKVYDVKLIVEDMPEIDETQIDTDEAQIDTEVKKGSQKAQKTTEGAEGKENKKDDDKKDIKKDEKQNKGDAEKKSEGEDAAEGEEEERKFNPKTEIQISDAKVIKKTAKIGDELKTKLEVPDAYGRMAAQTAKQVIIQRLREAERNMIFEEFKDKEHEVVSGVVQRREGRIVLVDLGKGVGILLNDEQIPGEQYRSGQRIKVYIKGVNLTPKGPEILLSRTSDEILKKVFYLEIPEISNGLIELKAVAREAGSRAKVAVAAESDNVDPIGSCVGQKGARIQTIISELGGEKVDIIEYDEDPAKFIANALSPARVLSIETKEKENKAIVTVSSDQLSLAIGKGGQNARLAARLSGWRVDIVEAKTEKAGGSKQTAEKGEEESGKESGGRQIDTDEKQIDTEKKDAMPAGKQEVPSASSFDEATEDKKDESKDKKKKESLKDQEKTKDAEKIEQKETDGKDEGADKKDIEDESSVVKVSEDKEKGLRKESEKKKKEESGEQKNE